MAVGEIVKWGNSLAVRIPKPVAQQAKVQEGDKVIIEASGNGIELRPAESIPSLETLVAQIKPENRYGEQATAPERGREKLKW